MQDKPETFLSEYLIPDDLISRVVSSEIFFAPFFVWKREYLYTLKSLSVDKSGLTTNHNKWLQGRGV